MNLREIANRATSAINPNIQVQWRKYLGYTTLPKGTVQISYAPAVGLIIQAQALSKKEIEHLEAMNISPCDRAAYANGQLQAVDRINKTGGDMLFFENAWWSVEAILEGWTTAGWCKVALVRRKEGPQ